MIQEALRQAAALIEALPYVRSFFNKVIVIKCGGNVLDTDHSRCTIAEDVAFMHFVGMKPVLVHGGGSMITKRLKSHGKNTVFVKGVRVTSHDDIKHVEDALSEINAQLFEILACQGVKAERISHDKKPLIKALQLHKDLDRVGKVHAIHKEELYQILNAKVPIVSPVGIDNQGLTYNINADEVAAELAVELKAEKLIFLTDVLGVMKDSDDKDTLISSLTSKQAHDLIDRSIIKSGMFVKVKAGLDALSRGVGSVHLISAKLEHALLAEIFTGKGIGTQLFKD